MLYDSGFWTAVDDLAAEYYGTDNDWDGDIDTTLVAVETHWQRWQEWELRLIDEDDHTWITQFLLTVTY